MSESDHSGERRDPQTPFNQRASVITVIQSTLEKHGYGTATIPDKQDVHHILSDGPLSWRRYFRMPQLVVGRVEVEIDDRGYATARGLTFGENPGLKRIIEDCSSGNGFAATCVPLSGGPFPYNPAS
jgi:hypothetical protein